MTVRELIVLLQKVDPSLSVITQGCDCNGEVGSIYVYVFKGKAGEEKDVYLCRGQEPRDPPIEGLEQYVKVEP